VSLPERHYDLAAQVMADAITQSQEKAVPIDDALRAAARDTGHALGEEANRKAGTRRSRASELRAVQEVLADRGYEPRADAAGVTLANCPFHALAQAHTTLVCGINLELIDSLLETAGPGDVRAELSPSPGRCCVRIART
jgi:predicted ArsR family transcriptional regulator